MTIACESPNCDHKFDDAISHGELEAREAGETPYFTYVHEPEDSIGIRTSYLCSARCLREFLDELDASEVDDAE